jgi:hypothetical protein
MSDVSPPTALIMVARLRHSSSALAVAFDALTSTEEINFSCFLDSLSTLRVAATRFFLLCHFLLEFPLRFTVCSNLSLSRDPCTSVKGPRAEGGLNGNALKPCKEQEVIVDGISVASSRSSGGDTRWGNKPALLRRRGQLFIEENRHGRGGGTGVRELVSIMLLGAGLVSSNNKSCVVLCMPTVVTKLG